METIKLDYPITADGAKVSALKMRRPKVRDLRAAEAVGKGNDADTEVRLFANLCEVSPEAIEELDIADYAKLQGTYRGFLPQKQTTSEPPAGS